MVVEKVNSFVFPTFLGVMLRNRGSWIKVACVRLGVCEEMVG